MTNHFVHYEHILLVSENTTKHQDEIYVDLNIIRCKNLSRVLITILDIKKIIFQIPFSKFSG